MIKGVIFDFDGVIANTLDFIFKEIINFSRHFNVKNLKEKQIIEKIRQSNYKDLFKKFQINWLKLPIILFLIKRAQYRLFEQIDDIRPFPKIKKLLNFLKKNQYLVFLVSSNIRKNIDRFLEINQLNVFDNIYTSNNFFGKDKIFLEILKKYRLKKEEVVYIGDELRDLQATKKAGIKFIGVSWGLARKKVFQENRADFIVKNPDEIIKIISS